MSEEGLKVQDIAKINEYKDELAKLGVGQTARQRKLWLERQIKYLESSK